MTTEVWVQPALFPKFPPVFYAYEMEAHGTWWEVYDDSGFLQSIEPEDFGDFLDFCRQINYDVRINTQESWEAMINELPSE
jgi:hypothetical protein